MYDDTLILKKSTNRELFRKLVLCSRTVVWESTEIIFLIQYKFVIALQYNIYKHNNNAQI